MKRKLSARIAATLLILHGLIEVAGLLSIITPAKTFAQTMENFGGMGKTQIAANMVTIILLGALWGITRFIAGWGTWSLKKWAFGLGFGASTASLIMAISIIPAGVVDTLLSAPVLILLLYTWFGSEKINL